MRLAAGQRNGDDFRRVLTPEEPFGPFDTENILDAGPAIARQLFDRSNLIYAQAASTSGPTYIIGRKGAGKTAFLLGSTLGNGQPSEELNTAEIYSEMLAVLRRYDECRAPLFVDQVADIWMALFEHVALFHAYRTASFGDPPKEMQVVYDYLGRASCRPVDATAMAAQFLAAVQRRVKDGSITSQREIVDGIYSSHGVSFAAARRALPMVLCRRVRQLIIVMDNIEDLPVQMADLDRVLAGLFRCVGRIIARDRDRWCFRFEICLPSEIFEQIQNISAAPEKDFRSSCLQIYWTAGELLKLAGSRFRLFLGAYYPSRLAELRSQAGRGGESDVAVLRAALPPVVRNGLGTVEDPLAYLLRHTQLLPRHIIRLLNSVFTTPVEGSAPWAVSERAVLQGTRNAEEAIVSGIYAAHRASLPRNARDAVGLLAGMLDICFPASQLHRVYVRQGIVKLTGLDFDEFSAMLFTLGVIGIRTGRTPKYNLAQFQYTLGAKLFLQEDVDYLCFHPLFTRHLHRNHLSRSRANGALVTYPHGCDPGDRDYRFRLGYSC